MSNQRSYNQVIDFLSGFTAQHLQIKFFKSGFRFDLNTAETLTNNYPLIFVEPTSHQYINWVQTYSLRIYCLDVKEKDSSNEQDIISDCLQILNDLVKYIQNNTNQTTDFDYQITNQPFSVPVTNYGVEFCSGWYSDVDLEVTINDRDCDIPLVSETEETISVYSQVLDFELFPLYNSIGYECDGNRIESCYSPGGQPNIIDLVVLFNTGFPDPADPSCSDPTFCYCWTDYGTYYDNGDGTIRCEMPVSVYNTLCSGGTLTLEVIYD